MDQFKNQTIKTNKPNEIGINKYKLSIPTVYAFLKRQAFNVTAREERDIPIPAIQGFTKPSIAAGIARTL
jgi:hypothetical protein